MHKAISVAGAAEMIPDGVSLMIGGFMGVGSPHRMTGGSPTSPIRS
jgi:acetate CoA/acetoacetate CoA-transferase alpha subunit